jgi:hypothetical protein
MPTACFWHGSNIASIVILLYFPLFLSLLPYNATCCAFPQFHSAEFTIFLWLQFSAICILQFTPSTLPTSKIFTLPIRAARLPSWTTFYPVYCFMHRFNSSKQKLKQCRISQSGKTYLNIVKLEYFLEARNLF